jgi:hypothetical protein
LAGEEDVHQVPAVELLGGYPGLLGQGLEFLHGLLPEGPPLGIAEGRPEFPDQGLVGDDRRHDILLGLGRLQVEACSRGPVPELLDRCPVEQGG